MHFTSTHKLNWKNAFSIEFKRGVTPSNITCLWAKSSFADQSLTWGNFNFNTILNTPNIDLGWGWYDTWPYTCFVTFIFGKFFSSITFQSYDWWLTIGLRFHWSFMIICYVMQGELCCMLCLLVNKHHSSISLKYFLILNEGSQSKGQIFILYV